MINGDIYQKEAISALTKAEFGTKTISELNIPELNVVEAADGAQLPYLIAGDVNAAKSLVFIDVPHSTSITDLSQQVRLMAQQTVLGPDYCVVGLQTYHPDYARFNAGQRDEVAHGSFLSMAERFARVVEVVARPELEQEIVVYGFSKGADVGVEVTYQNLLNPQFGMAYIAKLGVWDCARTTQQSPFTTVDDFNKSGDDLFENVIASNSVALLEARSIDIHDDKAQKKHEKAVVKGVVAYTKADILGSLALIRGYSRPTSREQLLEIDYEITGAPLTIVGRMKDSRVCPPDFTDTFSNARIIRITEKLGDHSRADRLSSSAAFVLETAQQAY